MKNLFVLFSIFTFLITCKKHQEDISIKINSKVENQPPPIVSEDTAKIYLTETQLLDFVKSTKTFEIKGKLNEPFNSFKFNKVIAYDYDGSEESIASVLDDNKNFVSHIEKQKELSESQVKKFINFITDKKSYGGPEAACFEPRMGIVFFEKSNPVFVVDICLNCNTLQATKNIPGKSGFSEIGIKKIENLSKELKLYYGYTNFENHF